MFNDTKSYDVEQRNNIHLEFFQLLKPKTQTFYKDILSFSPKEQELEGATLDTLKAVITWLTDKKFSFNDFTKLDIYRIFQKDDSPTNITGKKNTNKYILINMYRIAKTFLIINSLKKSKKLKIS